MESSKRLNYVDMVKGIAVLWVVFYHLLAPCAFKSVLDHLCDAILLSFFFYSGYFYRPGRRAFGENVKSRARALLVPFFKYSLFFWAVGSIQLVISGSETIPEALFCLRNFYVGCIWNRVIQGWFNLQYYKLGSRYFYLADFWFLLALFFASIPFFLIADRVLSSRKKTIGTALALLAVTGAFRHFVVSLPYNLQLIPFWTAIMLLGALTGQEALFEKPVFNGAKGWMLSPLLLAAGAASSMFKAPCLNLFRGSFGEPEVANMLLCVLSSLLFIPGLTGLCAQVERAGGRTKELCWLGSHSLLIYIYHMFLAWILCQITGFSITYEAPGSVGVMAGSVLLALACIALVILRYVAGERIAEKRRAQGK
ncbi:MAG: acyltransferase family protein [Clostridia bacterium]|nr:acyltransferase family protein [Clostridia bacterium]